MSVTTERIGELLREAEALKTEGQWSLEHYERLLDEAVSLVEAGSVQGRLLEPFVRLAPRAWREQVAARRRSRLVA